MPSVQPAEPIAAGYAASIRLSVSGGEPLFPNGCSLHAEVRDYPGAPVLAGTLDTASATVSIVDAYTLELFFPPELTGALQRRTCALDIVRTDVTPPRWTGIQLVLPVAEPVTRSPSTITAVARITSEAGLPGLATVSAPPGVTVTIGPAVDLGPWAPLRLIYTGPLTSTAFPAVVVAPTQTILTPAPQPASAIGLPAIAQVLPPAQTILPPAPQPTSAFGLPAIAVLPIGSKIITVAAPVASAAVLTPALSQSSPSPSYVADGYVADGYVGA